MIRRPDGVVLVAAYRFLAGFLNMSLGFFGLWVAVIAGAASSRPLWQFLFWGGLGLLFILLGAISIVVGIGLLRMRQWARWGALALALLALPSFPVGTVVGILTLWYLLRDDVGRLFRPGAL